MADHRGAGGIRLVDALAVPVEDPERRAEERPQAVGDAEDDHLAVLRRQFSREALVEEPSRLTN